MYIRSIAFASLVMGVLFKTLHWPGANIVLLASGVLASITMAFLLVKRTGPWTMQVQWPVMLVGSLITVMTGWMFKIMHWPGANLLLLVGLTICAAWFLIIPLKARPAL